MNAPQPYIPDAPVTSVPSVRFPPGVPVAPLGLNESCFGASPHAIEAARARAQSLWVYPDPASTALREAIGRTHRLDPAHIVCGNGSEELLDVVARVYVRAGDEIVFPVHGFMQFPVVAMRQGAIAVRAPERDHVIDVDALLSRITSRTRLVLIANPNNPTSTCIGRSALERLVDRVPSHVVLLIDAAYAEYVTDASFSAGHEFVAGRENVVVTRTLSKAYGLAALRVGWAHCPITMARLMNQVRGVGNINALAQMSAIAALEDQAFVANVARLNAGVREELARRYRSLGLEPLPSQANFFAVRFPASSGRTAEDAFVHLTRAGIWVRRLADCGMPDHLRITIGTDADNERLLTALQALLS